MSLLDESYCRSNYSSYIIRVTWNLFPIGGDDELDTAASNVGASKW